MSRDQIHVQMIYWIYAQQFLLCIDLCTKGALTTQYSYTVKLFLYIANNDSALLGCYGLGYINVTRSNTCTNDLLNQCTAVSVIYLLMYKGCFNHAIFIYRKQFLNIANVPVAYWAREKIDALFHTLSSAYSWKKNCMNLITIYRRQDIAWTNAG